MEVKKIVSKSKQYGEYCKGSANPAKFLSKTFLSENFELIGEYKKIFGMKAGVIEDQFSYSTPNDFIK